MAKHALESENKPIKRFIIILMVIILIALIVVVVYYNKNSPNPEDTINKAFTALKRYDIDEVNKHINYRQVLYSLDELLIDEKNEIVEKELFNSIKWKIDKIEHEGDTITAIIELTNKNFIKVITNWMKVIVQEKDEGKNITNKSSLKQLEKVLSETEETKTEINKITLIKEENEWIIQVTDEFRNLIYPGIETVSAVLENDLIK